MIRSFWIKVAEGVQYVLSVKRKVKLGHYFCLWIYKKVWLSLRKNKIGTIIVVREGNGLLLRISKLSHEQFLREAWMAMCQGFCRANECIHQKEQCFLAQATQRNHEVSLCNFSPQKSIPEIHFGDIQWSHNLYFNFFNLTVICCPVNPI